MRSLQKSTKIAVHIRNPVIFNGKKNKNYIYTVYIQTFNEKEREKTFFKVTKVCKVNLNQSEILRENPFLSLEEEIIIYLIEHNHFTYYK